MSLGMLRHQHRAGTSLTNHLSELGAGCEGEKEGRAVGSGEGEGTWADWAGQSRKEQQRIPKVQMLGKHTGPHTVPWLSPGIFCLGLAFLLGWVGLLQGHPQCLDYGPPFRPPLHLEFCSEYDAFGCCDQRKDQRLAAKYWDIMNYFDLKGHELCGGYIKDILCQVGLSVSLGGGRGGGEGASLEK